MKNYIKSIFSLSLLVLFFTGCEQDLESSLSNFADFEIGAEERSISVSKDATDSFDVKIYVSETMSSDRTFNIVVDMEATSLASPYSVPSTITIPGGTNEATLTFSVTDNDNLGFVAQNLVFGIEGFSGSEVNYAVTEECLNTIATFNLELDTWPDETTWEVYDLTDTPPTLIGSGGPYNNPADDFAELSFDFCLATGSYGVVVYDSYGDGGPTFSVTLADGTELVVPTTLGGSQSSATFDVD